MSSSSTIYGGIIYIPYCFLEVFGWCSIVILLLHLNRIRCVKLQSLHLRLHIHGLAGGGGGVCGGRVWGIVHLLWGFATPA